MRVASFLKELYADDIESERKEREELAQTAREWFTSGALPRAAVRRRRRRRRALARRRTAQDDGARPRRA